MHSEIHVHLPCGFHEGVVAHVGFGPIVKASREGILIGSAIGVDGHGLDGFGGPNVLAYLV